MNCHPSLRKGIQNWTLQNSTFFALDAATSGRSSTLLAPMMRLSISGVGPGRYMIELLKRGCHGTLFDLSPENIAPAKVKAAELDLTADDFLIGDARDRAL